MYLNENKYTEEDLLQKLQILKTNEEKVGKEVLRQKYAKGYEKLKNEIKNMSEDIFLTNTCFFLDTGEFILEARKKIKEEFEKLSDIIEQMMNSYSIKPLLDFCESVYKRIMAVRRTLPSNYMSEYRYTYNPFHMVRFSIKTHLIEETAEI